MPTGIGVGVVVGVFVAVAVGEGVLVGGWVEVAVNEGAGVRVGTTVDEGVGVLQAVRRVRPRARRRTRERGKEYEDIGDLFEKDDGWLCVTTSLA